MRKEGIVALVLALALCIACAAMAEETLTGRAKGFGGTVTVTVTRQGDTITAVDVQAPGETPGVGTPAIERLPAAIVLANGTDVDAIAGATVTSKAILRAVENALDPEAYPFEEEVPEARAQVEAAQGSVRTGFGACVSVADSEDGAARSTAVAVGLTLDADGRIAALQADVMEAEILMDEGGKLTVTQSQQFPSAKAMGDADWMDTLAAFEAQAIGKTAEEAGAMDADARLLDATRKAIETAMYLGATQGDALGLGVANVLVYDQLSHSRDASAERDGQAQAYHSYAVVTCDAQGILTSVILDSTQANVGFDAQGKLTSDISLPVATKIELRDQYGMRGLSGIGKEWFEQIWAISDYATGRTLADFQGISVNADGRIDDADLVSSATIQITELTEAMERAVENAR